MVIAAMACKEAEADAHFIIDNKATLERVQKAIAGRATLDADGFRRQADLIKALHVGTRSHAASWIPSHGKRASEWRPPQDYSEEQCRVLNGDADEGATAALVQAFTRRQELIDERGDAWTWASNVFGFLRFATLDYSSILERRIAAADIGRRSVAR
jgi:hypothetical protein